MAIPISLGSLSPREARIIGLAFAVKTVVAAAMLLFFFLQPDSAPIDNLWNRWYTGVENLSAWYLPFANWDGQHYLLLADRGYAVYRTTGSQAFYPLYPMLIGALSVVLPPWIAALSLNYLFTAGFCVFVYRIALHLQCPKPHLAVLLLLTFPSAFFTSAIYSESLFLLLQLGFLYHLLVSRSYAVLLYAFLMPLTRGTGIFIAGGLLLYIAVGYAQALYRAQREKWRRKAQGQSKRGRSHLRRRLPPAPPPPPPEPFDWRYPAYCFAAFFAGGVAYLLFMWAFTGDALSGLAGQSRFVAENSILNLLNPYIFLDHLLTDPNGVFTVKNSVYDRSYMVLFVTGILVFIYRREWSLLCFYFPVVYTHTFMNVSLTSYSRYMLVAAPLLVLAGLKSRPSPRPPYAGYALCAACFALQLYMAGRYSLNLWAG
ncbi:MAG: mannosyltransferase family protein [Gammaproteobacteria bacterium]|nr:mannosyltransferase family protein [Gammaproteobacteria bacterium]